MSFPKQLLGTGASAPKEYNTLKNIIKMAVESGIRGFDTAPSYKNEELLAKAIKELLSENDVMRKDLFIQTKIDIWQMMEGPEKIKAFVEKSLEKMNLEYFDSLLIHWPAPEYIKSTWKTFVKLKEENIVRNIGVCNVRKRQLSSFLKNDIFPEIIQIERNPLLTFSAEVDFCRKNNIEVQAYSPLCKMDKRIAESQEIKQIANKYGKSIGQVVLRWHIDTGVSPVFTSTKPERIKEYSEIFDFNLNDEEIEIINSLNIDYKMYLEAWACPGF